MCEETKHHHASGSNMQVGLLRHHHCHHHGLPGTKQQKHVQKAIKHYQILKQEAHLGSHGLCGLRHLQGGKCQVTRNTKQLGLSP